MSWRAIKTRPVVPSLPCSQVRRPFCARAASRRQPHWDFANLHEADAGSSPEMSLFVRKRLPGLAASKHIKDAAAQNLTAAPCGANWDLRQMGKALIQIFTPQTG